MGNISLLISSGIIAFIAAYALFALIKNAPSQEKDFSMKVVFFEGLKILMLGLLITSILLIGKTAYDDRNTCEWVTANTTEVYVYGNYFDDYHWDGYNITAPSQTDKSAFLFHKDISHEYEYICTTNNSSTASWQLKLPLTIIRIVAILTMLYLLFQIYNLFKYISGDKRDYD